MVTLLSQGEVGKGQHFPCACLCLARVTQSSMSTALDRLKQAVSMKPQRKAIELPDGSEFEFWMTPLTLAERSRAQKQAKSDDATDFALQLLVAKATDENGGRLFNVGDLADLRNVLPASVVEGLMLQLLQDPEPEDGGEELDPKASGSSSKKTTS